jgi:hypothetical protein
MSKMRRLNVDAIMYIGFCSSSYPFSRGFHALSVHHLYIKFGLHIKSHFTFSKPAPDVGTMEPSTDHFLKPSRI